MLATGQTRVDLTDYKIGCCIVYNIRVTSSTFEEVNILMTQVAKCGIFLERVTHKPCTLSEHHLPIHTLLITVTSHQPHVYTVTSLHETTAD